MIHDRLGHIDGYGESNADIGACWGVDGRVDADDVAAEVSESSTTVHRIDRSICLDEIILRVEKEDPEFQSMGISFSPTSSNAGAGNRQNGCVSKSKISVSCAPRAPRPVVKSLRSSDWSSLKSMGSPQSPCRHSWEDSS